MSIIASHVRTVVEAVIGELDLNVPRLEVLDPEVLDASAYGATLSEWWIADGDRSCMRTNFFTGMQMVNVGGMPPPAWERFLPESFTFEPGQGASRDTVFDYLDAMGEFAYFSLEQGAMESSVNICELLVQRLELISGGRCERAKAARNLLGDAYRNIRAGHEAVEQFCTLILRLDEPGDPAELEHATNLAAALYETGRDGLSRRIFQAALDDVDRDVAAHAGEDYERTPLYRTIVQNLAGLESEMGNDAEAEQLFLRIFPRESWHNAHADADELSGLRNIALLLQRQAKYGEAIELYTSVAQRRATLMGTYHPATEAIQQDIAICRAKLASV